MKQITFNCFKRLALMVLCVFAFTANSFAQDEWVEFISDPLTDNSWTDQWATYEFEIKDPYYCGFTEAVETGKLTATHAKSTTRSEIPGVTGICFPYFENNGNVPDEYFAVKTYLTPGKYKFSYRFKKNSNKEDDLAFFYTKDLNGERTVVLEKMV